MITCLRAVEIGFIILVVALGAQWLLNARVPAAWRVWLWRIALLQTALAVAPLAPIRLALLSPPAQQSVTTKTTSRVPLTSIAVAPPSNVIPKEESAHPVTSPLETQIHPPISASKPIQVVETPPRPRIALNGQCLLLAFYALGVAGHLAWLWRSAVRVRSTLRTSSVVEDANTLAPLREVVASLRLHESPRLLSCESGAPFLIGILRPTIVLPRAYLNATEDQLKAIFAHELVHTIRRDLAWNALLWLIGTLFWFHPLVWIARRFHSLEVESACDELVLQTTSIAPKFYAELLLNAMNFHQSPLTAGVGDGFFALKTRLSRLNRAPLSPSKFIRFAFIAAVTLTFAALVPFRLVARAQSTTSQPKSPPKDFVTGTVRDQNNQPLAGATVYYVDGDGNEKLTQKTLSDANGDFRLPMLSVQQPTQGYAFADMGRQGMTGTVVSTRLGRESSPLNLKVTSGVQAKVRLLDPQNLPAANLKVQLRTLWLNPGMPIYLPSSILQRLNATTNAQGEATLPPLPTGMWATFKLGDSPTGEVPPAIASKFAPLALEDYVALSPAAPIHTIHLLAPLRLSGRVMLGNSGKSASGDYVYAGRLTGGGVGYKGSIVPIDAQGNYLVKGLRPGEYRVMVLVSKWAKDWVSSIQQPTLTAPATKLDFVLTHGALIDGVVVAQKTKRPVPRMIIDLRDEYGYGDTATSDAQGRFHFRAPSGKQKMRISNLPPNGLRLPNNGTFEFTTREGDNLSFRYELPSVPGARPITGQVVGPNGQPMPGATVFYRRVGLYNNSSLLSSQCDSKGRFSILLPHWPRPLQLFADAGELTTPRSILATNGDNVKLQVQANAWSSIEGRVVDEKGQPLPQTKLRFLKTLGYVGEKGFISRPAPNGSYRFQHLRPGMGFSLRSSLTGYYAPGVSRSNLAPGQQLKVDIVMRRPSTFLSGRVEDAYGKPAGGYQISAAGSEKPVVTDVDGTFFLPHVLSGPIDVWVISPKQQGKTSYWSYLKARGGDEYAVIHLSSSPSLISDDASVKLPSRPALISLVSQRAPEIRASRWSNNTPVPLSSLRGQVVLMLFTDIATDSFSPELREVARSFSDRFKIVGVQRRFKNDTAIPETLEANARRLGIPIALDTLHNGVSQTYDLYAKQPYIVIGRSGRIAYNGPELDRALIIATTLSKRK